MREIEIPGLIDTHVHLREPGAEHKEDFETGTKAAIAGGVTAVLDMPNNPTPTVSSNALNDKLDRAKGRVYSDIGFHFGATPSSIGDFDSVKDEVFGYKLYMDETTGDLKVDREEAEEIFAQIPEGKIIIVHAEGPTLDYALDLARIYRKRLHAAHVSLASEVEAIRMAQLEGLDVTAETTPHHLFLTSDSIHRLKGYGRMKPPLRKRQDIESLWEGIRQGVIEVVATDHAPHTKQEKEGEKPPFGVPGLETTLPLLLTALTEGRISLSLLRKVTYDNPKRIFGINPQESTVRINLDEEGVIRGDRLQTKAGWTPFDGFKVQGRILEVRLGKKIVYDGENVVGEPQGRVLKP
jgi:dihydroorotase